MFLQLELDNIVTLHMRSRKFSSPQCFSEIARALANLGHIANGRQIYTPNVSDVSQVTLPVLQSLGFRVSSKLINLPGSASQYESQHESKLSLVLVRHKQNFDGGDLPRNKRFLLKLKKRNGTSLLICDKVGTTSGKQLFLVGRHVKDMSG